MKKLTLVFAAVLMAGRIAALPVSPADEKTASPDEQASRPDSIRMVQLESVSVISTRAGEKTPMVYTNINRGIIEKTNNGVDMPFLLLNTPSVVATSEAGAGVGYTGVRIRGADATRINVTINGIPMNDAESHSVFWVNTPDLAASLEDIQVQRGVGTSTNGAGAFGGSLNLKSQSLKPVPYGEVSGSYGSFNTHRESINLGSGLLKGRWAFNARLSAIHSDGYRDRASTALKSYFLQGGYYGNNTSVKLIVYGGREQTYHAWDGVTKEEMKTLGRRYNPCGLIREVVRNADGTPVFKEDGKPVMRDAGWYSDQTDDYRQTNYQLLLNQRLSDRFNLNVNFHYTDGFGFYEQYKEAGKLQEYGLKNFVPADATQEAYLTKDSTMVNKSDLVRRKMMDNWFGGGVFSLDYTAYRIKASLGGAVNKYDGDHYGRVMWLQNYAGDYNLSPEHRYYENKGEKFDANVYLKANWQVTSNLHLYGDLQYRRINYKMKGHNDKWDDAENNGAGGMMVLDVDNNYNFFNPKAGISYDFSPAWNAYASIAVTHKEPTRNNFTDGEPGDNPVAERLTDYEAGVNYQSPVFSAGVNFYYMKYKDQFILTGRLNHIGEAMLTNIPDSYRAGIEVTAGVRPTSWLRWDVNATLSRNKIKGYTDQLFDWGTYQHVDTYLGTTTIAYSPGFMAGSLISAEFNNFGIYLQSNYVGSQYITNSESEWNYEAGDATDRLKLDSYFVNNLRMDYTFRLPSLRTMTVGLAVNNLFNAKYCSNGYGWSEFDDDGARFNKVYYFPQAGINVLGSITVRF